MRRFQIPKAVFNVLRTLTTNGYQAFLVGGCVRDLLLGKQPKDFDICTKALPEQVKGLFPKVIETGIKYGTVTVLSEGFSIEVTTFRKVVHNPDGPRANQIIFGTEASEDALKRDFTINGLLYDGSQVIDYVGGTADLTNRIIRAIEDPDARFSEDPLRMLRAIRFCCLLDFDIELITFNAISRNTSLIAKVSVERIREELNKILISNFPAKGFRLMYHSRLLKMILPELNECYGFNQLNPHHSQDVFEHTLTVVDNTPPELIIRWAALLHDIGKPLTFSMDEQGIGHFYEHQYQSYQLAKDILMRLKFDNKTINQVSLLILKHMSLLKNIQKKAIKKLINRVGVENINRLLELQIADLKGMERIEEVENLKQVNLQIQKILQKSEPISLRDLAINGDDLIELGIQPGKSMGAILMKLLERVIDNPDLNTRNNLIALIKEFNLDQKGDE